VTRLVLWDIDHTLIENAGVSKEIYAAAFLALTGRPPHSPASTEGRTDPNIMADMFRTHGEPQRAWPQIERALERAGRDRREALAARGHVLPGALDAIKALGGISQVAQTIVTGNIRANAEVKLDAFGLGKWFDLTIGGYGSDNTNRARLVEIAKDRATAKYGMQLAVPQNVVVIGDTPRDIEAANRGGARALGVSSGVHGVGELRAAGPACVVSDLADTAAVVAFVLNTAARTCRDPA
jgi:phosphoglycolate phosphatase